MRWRRPQPEGLADSSRWSQRSEDHRTTTEMTPDPEGVSEILALLRSADKRWLRSGGLRCAATTGYYLAALRAENHVLPREGVPSSRARVLGARAPTRYRVVVLTSLAAR